MPLKTKHKAKPKHKQEVGSDQPVVYQSQYRLSLFRPKFDKPYLRMLVEDLKTWILDRDSGQYWLGTFAVDHGLTRQTLERLAKKFPATVGYWVELARAEQESRLIAMGFVPRVNPSLPIFILKNVTDMKDVGVHKVDGSMEMKIYSTMPRPEIGDTSIAADGSVVEAGSNGNGKRKNGHSSN